MAIEPAPTPGGIDFGNWTYNTLPERTGNVGWQPDLQELIYTAINHVEGDYEDADENCAEQVIERLVLAIKALLSAASAGALGQIQAERRRQIDDERWTPAHDDEHGDGALAAAAACYAIKASQPPHNLRFSIGYPPPYWPGWATKWWKPQDRRRDLVRAGALIVAEIERLHRLARDTGGRG